MLSLLYGRNWPINYNSIALRQYLDALQVCAHSVQRVPASRAAQSIRAAGRLDVCRAEYTRQALDFMRGCQGAGFVLLHITLSYIVDSNSGDYSPPCLSSITSCASRALRTISDALLRCFCASCNTRSFIHTGSRIVIVVMGSGLLLYNLSPSHNVVVKVVGCACLACIGGLACTCPVGRMGLACVCPLGPCPWDTMRISQVVLHVNPLARLFFSPAAYYEIATLSLYRQISPYSNINPLHLPTRTTAG